MTTSFRVHVRDRPVATSASSPAPMPLIGEVDAFLTVEATATHRGTGTWLLTIPVDDPQAKLFKPGRGMAVFLDSSPDKVAFSGPVRKVKQTKNKDTGGKAILAVSGPCDNAILKERLGRINPTAPYNREDEVTREWVPTVYDGTSNRAPKNSGEFIWGLIVANFVIPTLASSADSSRRLRYLDMPRECPVALRSMPADDEWRRYPMKLDSIEEAVWELADLLDLSIRFLYDPNTGLIKPTIAPIEDVSDTVLFDEAAGNLAGYDVTAEAPVFDRLFMAGKTPESDDGRRYYEHWRSGTWDPPGWVDIGTPGSTPDQWSDRYWGRKAIEVEWNMSAESFLDVRESEWGYQSNPSNPGAAMPPPVGSKERDRFYREGLAAFVENSQRGSITLEAVDTEECQYGVHYDLGQTVRVLLDTSALPESMLDSDGIVRQPVQEVKIACSADEMWTISPVVGPAETSSTPYIYRMLRRLRRFVESVKNRV